MRITQTVSNFVRNEIDKKYQPAIDAIGKEYEDKKQEDQKKIQEILAKASEEAVKYLTSQGYEVHPQYNSDGIFRISGWFGNKAIENELSNKREKLAMQRNAKIDKILFDLEIGETDKQQLKEAIDAVIVEEE